MIARALLLIALSSTAPKIEVGSELPEIAAKTLSGEPAELPRDARGHSAVVVFGFSKAAMKMTRPWLEPCRARAVSCYEIRMLEDVPKPFRGSVERGMRNGAPLDIQRATLLLYADNDAWRRVLGVTDDESAYVLGLDAEGRVRGRFEGAYSSDKLERMLDVTRGIPGPHAP